MRYLSLALSALFVAALLVGTGPRDAAAQSMAGTFHDLSTLTTGTTEICIFCHFPHTDAAVVNTSAPLWNRTDNTTSTFQIYTSPTIDMTVNAVRGVSLACLSCHDGVSAIDSLVRGGSVAGAGLLATDTMSTILGIDPANIVGLDLRDDHPVSVTYDNVADTAFNAPVAGRLTVGAGPDTLPLFRAPGIQTGDGTEVECASCHDPHNATVAEQPFLRVANTGSQICLACHAK